MSYQVLARKWRPQTFNEVVGQQPIIQTLQNALRSKRVAQAFLFAGPRGVGKTSVARILAKALNCQAGPTPAPCNQCESCIEITKTIAPDVFEIDGASNTGVDNVRDLQETIKYLPQKQRYKIFIVDEVHMLSPAAFNAFLKTLEEPPAHVVFIFATTEPHKIIKTVVDRCQRYDFKKISSSVILEHVRAIAEREAIDISPHALQLIAREADGSLRDAESMVDQLVTYAGNVIQDHQVTECLGLVDQTVLREIVSAVLNSRLKDCLELVGTVFDYGSDVRHFYRGLVEYFRNLMVSSVSTEPQLFPDFQGEEIAEFRQLASGISLERLQTIMKMLVEHEGLLYRATMPRIVLEALLLRIATMPTASSLKEIAGKLALIQEKLPGSVPAQVAPDSSGREPSGGLAKNEQEVAEKTPSVREHAPSEQSLQIGGGNPGLTESASTQESWLGLMAFIRQRKPLLGSLLDHGTLVGMRDGSLNLEFPGNSIYSESLKEDGKRQELTTLCEEYFGGPMMITIADNSALLHAGNGEESGLSRSQKNDRIREEARTHPLIREALALFGGGIAEIKVTSS